MLHPATLLSHLLSQQLSQKASQQHRLVFSLLPLPLLVLLHGLVLLMVLPCADGKNCSWELLLLLLPVALAQTAQLQVQQMLQELLLLVQMLHCCCCCCCCCRYCLPQVLLLLAVQQQPASASLPPQLLLLQPLLLLLLLLPGPAWGWGCCCFRGPARYLNHLPPGDDASKSCRIHTH
jgi:hypothetical protein